MSTVGRTLVIVTERGIKQETHYSVPDTLLIGWDYTMPVEVLQDYADDPDSGVREIFEDRFEGEMEVTIMRDS